MNSETENIVKSKFREMSLKFLSPKNAKKSQYKYHILYCLSEARRAVAFAYKDAVLRNNESYREWMLSAVDFLTDAEETRIKYAKIPWRMRI